MNTTQDRKPASEIDSEGRSYAYDVMRGQVDTLQRLRRARYLAMIESGQGAGTVDRDALRAGRVSLGLTADRVKGVRRAVVELATLAGSLGYDGLDVASQGRRDALGALRAENAGITPLLTRGQGVYPGPLETRRRRNRWS